MTNMPGVFDSSENDAEVDLSVHVAEVSSGVEVLDAEVVGGKAGDVRPLPLTRPNTYSHRRYARTVVGYGREWELSIVRRNDVLKGIVLVGPSFPSVGFSPAAGAATIEWWPARGVGVSTVACATQLSGPRLSHALRWCRAGRDEGRSVLTSADEDLGRSDPFPRAGATYRIAVDAETTSRIGAAGGSGSVRVFGWKTTTMDP
jgi:hypothetical protein